MPIQQMLLGAGGAGASKTYMDDVFSMDTWTGDNSTKTITNGIDLAGEGGMTWIKTRNVGDSGRYHALADTVRGTNKLLRANDTDEQKTVSSSVQAFNSNGFELGGAAVVNFNTSDKYIGYTFRKQKGFFTIKQYTGTGSTQSLTHDLGSIPGAIFVKKLSGSPKNWGVYHRRLNNGVDPEDYRLRLNGNGNENDETYWGDTAPTATHFTVGNSHDEVNASNETYVAYLFAGGESTAATARSVKFDNDIDALEIASSSDFGTGTGAFTWEAWVKPADSPTYNPLWMVGNYGDGGLAIQKQGGNYRVVAAGVSNYLYWSGSKMPIGEWTHVAVCRSGSTLKAFLNGTEVHSTTCTYSFASGKAWIGWYGSNMNVKFNGLISNVRWIKGSALYTSSFNPPTEPLTNVTNTKLLCCNNSSVTGSTVTPSTISQIDSASGCTATTDSPFDDPAGFIFGETGDQNIIKCGNYTGTGGSSGSPEINLGFEPQWLLVKSASVSGTNWYLVDTMRGFGPHDVNERILRANLSDGEDGGDPFNLTSTGFSLFDSNDDVNGSGQNYIYIAIRRSDGYVQKPVEDATKVFSMDTGNNSSTIPAFDSGFPVDFALSKKPGSTLDWVLTTRITGTKELVTNSNSGESTDGDMVFDNATGWAKNRNNTYQSWMWKRSAGLDVVNYLGQGGNRTHRHNLNAVPEMMWVKCRANTSKDWWVYHKGMNGGTNPEDYYQKLNNGDFALTNEVEAWNDTAPTATTFTVGSNSAVNSYGDKYLAILFASVKGVSSVGYYSGNNSGQTITIPDGGFQPRFIIIKSQSAANWYVFDTVRGWTQSLTLVPYLRLDTNNAQSDHPNDDPADVGYPTSTGFYLTGVTSGNGYSATNKTGKNYIYYAHA